MIPEAALIGLLVALLWQAAKKSVKLLDALTPQAQALGVAVLSGAIVGVMRGLGQDVDIGTAIESALAATGLHTIYKHNRSTNAEGSSS